MKTLFKFLIASILLMVAYPATDAIAQTGYQSRNVSESFKKSANTTSAAASFPDTIYVADGEAGILNVKCLAYYQDSTEMYYAEKRFRYVKSGGSLTVTAVDSSQTVTSKISGAGIFIGTTDYGNLRTALVGKASKTLKWVWTNTQYFRRPSS